MMISKHVELYLSSQKLTKIFKNKNFFANVSRVL